jgi:hypothetical protein
MITFVAKRSPAVGDRRDRVVAIGIVWTLRARTIPLEKCAHAEPGVPQFVGI